MCNLPWVRPWQEQGREKKEEITFGTSDERKAKYRRTVAQHAQRTPKKNKLSFYGY